MRLVPHPVKWNFMADNILVYIIVKSAAHTCSDLRRTMKDESRAERSWVRSLASRSNNRRSPIVAFRPAKGRSFAERKTTYPHSPLRRVAALRGRREGRRGR